MIHQVSTVKMANVVGGVPAISEVGADVMKERGLIIDEGRTTLTNS